MESVRSGGSGKKVLSTKDNTRGWFSDRLNIYLLSSFSPLALILKRMWWILVFIKKYAELSGMWHRFYMCFGFLTGYSADHNDWGEETPVRLWSLLLVLPLIAFPYCKLLHPAVMKVYIFKNLMYNILTWGGFFNSLFHYFSFIKKKKCIAL